MKKNILFSFNINEKIILEIICIKLIHNYPKTNRQ